MFIKTIKGMFLIFLGIIFFILSFVVFSSSVFRSTLLSPTYFNKHIEKNINIDAIEILLIDTGNNLESVLPIGEDGDNSSNNEILAQTEVFKEILKGDEINNWIADDLIDFTKDSFAYATGNTEDFPSISILPLKKIFIDIFIEQIRSHSGPDLQQQVDEIINQINSSFDDIIIGKTVSDDAIEEFMSTEMAEEFDITRETAKEILEKIDEYNKTKDFDKLFENTVREMIEDRTGFKNMNPELDLGILLETIYGNKENTLSVTVSSINNIIDISFNNLFLIFTLIFLSILVIAFYPSTIFRFTGIIFILMGIAGISNFILRKISQNQIIEMFDDMKKTSDGIDMSFLKQLILDYSSGIFNRFIIIGVIIFIIGVIFLVLSSNFSHKISEENEKGSGRAFINLVRFIIFIAIVISIVSISKNYVRDIKIETDRIKSVSSKQEKKIDINKALDDVLNVKLFSMMSSEE